MSLLRTDLTIAIKIQNTMRNALFSEENRFEIKYYSWIFRNKLYF